MHIQKRRIHQRHEPNQQGFTIVELMIATMVFSVILTVITMGVMAFTRSYFKGVHASATQNTARNVIDTIAQSIEFGTAAITPTNGSDNFFCAGGYVFVFARGQVFTGDTATQTGLYMQPMSGSNCQAPGSLTGGKQLLGNNMRLLRLNVTPNATASPPTYTVDVAVAYAKDNDMLCEPTTHAGSCDEGATALTDSELWNVAANDVTCRQSGNEYCTVSKLSSAVQKRISN